MQQILWQGLINGLYGREHLGIELNVAHTSELGHLIFGSTKQQTPQRRIWMATDQRHSSRQKSSSTSFPKMQQVSALLHNHTGRPLELRQSLISCRIQRDVLGEGMKSSKSKFDRLARLQFELKQGFGSTTLELVAGPLGLRSRRLLAMAGPWFA